MSTFSVIKDPSAVLDYSVDWTLWLDGDTITDSAWTVTGPDTDMVVDSDTNSSTATTVWLSGGTVNRTYTATNRVTTAAGRIDDRSILIKTQNK